MKAKRKTPFSDPEIARKWGAIGGANVPAEKRKFFTDRAFASRASKIARRKTATTSGGGAH